MPNFCQQHWDELKAAIEARDLMQFVAKDGKQAMENMVRDLEGQNTVVDYEPLLGSDFCMSNVAMSFYGLRMMAVEEGEEKPPCPVCMMQKMPWIEWVASGALAEAIRRGLIADPNKQEEPDGGKSQES